MLPRVISSILSQFLQECDISVAQASECTRPPKLELQKRIGALLNAGLSVYLGLNIK